MIYHGQKIIGYFGSYFKNMAVKSGEHIGIGHLWISENIPNLSDHVTKKLPVTHVHNLVLKALN